MGLGDVLALAAGTARGYRASQALQREIQEARRKHLLEEREMDLRGRQVAAIEALQKAQAKEIGVDTDIKRDEHVEKQTPFSNVPFDLDIQGNQFSIPKFNLNKLGMLSPLLQGLEGNATQRDVANEDRLGREKVQGLINQGNLDQGQQRIDNPQAFGGSGRGKNTDPETEYDDAVQGIIQRVISDPVFGSLAPEDQEKRLETSINAMRRFGSPRFRGISAQIDSLDAARRGRSGGTDHAAIRRRLGLE